LFQYALLKEIRLAKDIGRQDLAGLFGISDDYLYRLESGLRDPCLNFMEKFSRYFGVSIDPFFDERGDGCQEMFETPDGPGGVKDLTDMIRNLNQERSGRRAMEKRARESERLTEHFMAVCELYARYAEILVSELPQSEKTKKTAAVARKAARTGELRFDEIQAILRADRATLRRWLESEKTGYRCKLSEENTVMACTPDEAELLLACFDCEKRASGDCRGYGKNVYPENLCVLLCLLNASGIYGRAEQSQVLRKSYGIELSPHQISEFLSRKRHGKPVPEDIENMDIRKRSRD
jgi:transcriptional regulator with XRE-family HTH domain